MNNILIHTTSTQQVKLFEDLAKALGVSYELEIEDAIKPNSSLSGFMQEFKASLHVESSILWLLEVW